MGETGELLMEVTLDRGTQMEGGRFIVSKREVQPRYVGQEDVWIFRVLRRIYG